jgi:hypothetical protein
MASRLLVVLVAVAAGACAPVKPSFKLGPWQRLPSEGGTTLVLEGARLAVASPSHVAVWEGDRRLVSVESKVSAPGVPRLVGNSVLHGPGIIDIGSGELLLRDAAIPPTLRYGRGDTAVLYSWSPEADRLVVTLRGGGPEARTKVMLHDGATGNPRMVLFEGAGEPPPASVWIGRRATLVGFQQPLAFDLSDGHEIAPVLLDPPAPIAQIEATRDERLLVVVVRGQGISLVDGASFALLDTWAGSWSGGAISDDGRYAVGADASRRALHVACIDGGKRFRDIGTVEIDPRHASFVALGGGRVSLVGGDAVMVGKLAVDCRNGKR